MLGRLSPASNFQRRPGAARGDARDARDPGGRRVATAAGVVVPPLHLGSTGAVATGRFFHSKTGENGWMKETQCCDLYISWGYIYMQKVIVVHSGNLWLD